MRRVEKLMAEYAESHQHPQNILLHHIAVPVIYFVTFGLLWAIPVPGWMADFGVTFAHVAIIPVIYYYFRLSGPIGAAMTLMSVAVFLLIEAIEKSSLGLWQTCLVLFVIMWGVQFIGHHIEGKRPSFFKDLQFLLVGPAWVMSHLLKRLNIGI